MYSAPPGAGAAAVVVVVVGSGAPGPPGGRGGRGGGRAAVAGRGRGDLAREGHVGVAVGADRPRERRGGAGVHHDQVVQRFRAPAHRGDGGGGEPGPGRTGVGGPGRGGGRRQGVAAVALDHRHAAVVHQHRGAGLQDGGNRGGPSVREPVVGHGGVGPQHGGCEQRDEVGDRRGGDAQRPGPGPGLVGVVLQEGGHPGGVTGGHVAGAAVQPRGVSREGTGFARGDGHRCRGGARHRVADGRDGHLAGRRGVDAGHERVGAGRRGGLAPERGRPGVPAAAGLEHPGQDDGEDQCGGRGPPRGGRAVDQHPLTVSTAPANPPWPDRPPAAVAPGRRRTGHRRPVRSGP